MDFPNGVEKAQTLDKAGEFIIVLEKLLSPLNNTKKTKDKKIFEKSIGDL